MQPGWHTITLKHIHKHTDTNSYTHTHTKRHTQKHTQTHTHAHTHTHIITVTPPQLRPPFSNFLNIFSTYIPEQFFGLLKLIYLSSICAPCLSILSLPPNKPSSWIPQRYTLKISFIFFWLRIVHANQTLYKNLPIGPTLTHRILCSGMEVGQSRHPRHRKLLFYAPFLLTFKLPHPALALCLGRSEWRPRHLNVLCLGRTGGRDHPKEI